MAKSHGLGVGEVESGFKRYPKYRDSGVAWLGEIPEHWKVAALRYRYEQSRGKMLDMKRITGDHLVPYLRNVDVQWDSINLLDLPRMDILPHEIERYTVREGDLLVCEGGEAGRCAIWRGGMDPCGYQKALHRLRPLDGSRDVPRFLYYTLVVASRGSFANGQGSTIAHLTGELLRAHRFPFPSMTEQCAIADFLDRETGKIESLVRKKQHLVELLREKREALISRAVTRGLDPGAPMKETGVRWLGEIPAHWDIHRLKTLADVKISNVDKKTTHGQVGVRLCNYTDVYYRDEIAVDSGLMAATATEDQVERLSLRKGDVLITKDSETPDDIAVPAVIAKDLPGVVSGYHLAHLTPDDTCDGRYLKRAFESIGPREQFRIAANGVTRFGLTASAIGSSQFPFPPYPEQVRIVDHLDRECRKLDTLVEKIQSAIDRLLEYRSAIISAAVTGAIDVRRVMSPGRV